MNKSEAGFIGGMQTFLKHGSAHMRETGKKGGRTRLPTISEINAGRKKNIERRNQARGPAKPGLEELKRDYRHL